MKKLKRILCIIMSAVIITGAALTSYIEAQAMEVVALPLLEDLLLSLGISFGIGEQLDFWKNSRKQALDDYISAILDGETIALPEYGEVNFSNSQSIMSFFDWSLKCNKFLLGDASVADYMDITYGDTALKLDQISYHNTGTSATNAMNDSISAFYNDYNGSFEALAEDIKACFSVIQGGGDFNDDDDDNEEKIARRQKFWRIFGAVTAAGMIGFGNTAIPLAALKEYSDSEFSEYDAVFGEAYFDGKYTMNEDQQYVYSISGEGDQYRFVFDKVVSSDKIVGIINHELNRVNFYKLSYNGSSPVLFPVSLRISQQIDLVSGRVYENGKSYNYCGLNNYSGNIPLYSNQDAAINALESGDFSDAENIQSSYSDFKANTKGAGSVVGVPFSNYIGTLRSLADISDIVSDISDASNSYGGTAEALEEVADILNKAAGIVGTNPDPDVDDPSSSSGNYSGILGKILTAINNLPVNILNKFVSKFMTAEGLTKLINNLPSLFAEAFKVVLDLALNPVISAINAVPVGMYLRLIEIFPNSEAVGNAIIGFPDAVAQAVSAISVKVPEIKIPEIEIPDIKIPEIILPDIHVEVNPNITLDPSYNITVQNDYTGLGGIIINSVKDAATELFVPEEGPTLDKIDEMKEYFKFKDDMEVIIYEFKKNIFGIKPDPVLKIPIGKPTSKKYDFGTGSYIIIDVSWYAKYKDFGDKIILAFAWAFFIWRIFVGLPGIISGGVGGIQVIGDAYTVYKKNGSGD